MYSFLKAFLVLIKFKYISTEQNRKYLYSVVVLTETGRKSNLQRN